MREIAWTLILILQVLEHLVVGTKKDAAAYAAEITDHKAALLRRFGYSAIDEQEPVEGTVPTRDNGGS